MYNSANEIAEKYEQMSQKVVYPVSFKKPVREQFENNSAFGCALDQYEEYYHNTFIPAKKEYNLAHERITQAFKRDLLEYLEVANHPAAEKLWNLAWEHGHSSGYGEVAMYTEEFVELMK